MNDFGGFCLVEGFVPEGYLLLPFTQKGIDGLCSFLFVAEECEVADYGDNDAWSVVTDFVEDTSEYGRIGWSRKEYIGNWIQNACGSGLGAWSLFPPTGVLAQSGV